MLLPGLRPLDLNHQGYIAIAGSMLYIQRDCMKQFKSGLRSKQGLLLFEQI